MTKKCSKCRQTKAIDLFSFDRTDGPDKRRSDCKECDNKTKRAKWAADKEKRKSGLVKEYMIDKIPTKTERAAIDKELSLADELLYRLGPAAALQQLTIATSKIPLCGMIELKQMQIAFEQMAERVK